MPKENSECSVPLQQHHQTRRKLFEISHSLRSMMYGQDRYRRRYWVLPHCGGVFIEAMESGEGNYRTPRDSVGLMVLLAQSCRVLLQFLLLYGHFWTLTNIICHEFRSYVFLLLREYIFRFCQWCKISFFLLDL